MNGDLVMNDDLASEFFRQLLVNGRGGGAHPSFPKCIQFDI